VPLDPRTVIAGGENAKTGFKRDDRTVRPEHLAREVAAFANLNGSMIVIGVEDDGTVSGVTRRNLAGLADGHGDRALYRSPDRARLR